MDILSSLANFFISSAHADAPVAAAATPPGANNFQMIVMLAIFVLFMYFVMWRPQSKRAKEQKELLNSLKKGDEVVTAGGILGKISKVTESYAVISLSEAVEITIQKSSIISALPKGTLKSI